MGGLRVFTQHLMIWSWKLNCIVTVVGLAGTSYAGEQYDITCKVNGYLPDGGSERRAIFKQNINNLNNKYNFMEIDFLNVGIKNFYSYRSNRCKHSFVIDNVPFSKIKEYVEEQGFRMDNHISWENEYGLCFTYSDHSLYIGNKMIGRSW